MPAADAVWRLIEAYGMLIGMLLGLVILVGHTLAYSMAP